MPALIAEGLTKWYSDRRGPRAALDGVSFTVQEGRTLVVLGPSGAGKTTLLRTLAGLDSQDAGRIRLGERDISQLPSDARRVALVFQDDALFPHLTIYDNLAFSLRLRRIPEHAARERIEAMARALAIFAHLHERPARLSGGERQRASIARAVLSDPEALALDEPLAHLDPQLRAHVRSQFVTFRKRFCGPVIYVTHDHNEAFAVADDLAVLMEGAIIQHGDPQTVYDFPADVRVARFFGTPAMNLLDDGMDTIGIRPEYVIICRDGALHGEITGFERNGPDRYARIATVRGMLLARVPQTWHDEPAIGERVALDLPKAYVRRFDRSTGKARKTE